MVKLAKIGEVLKRLQKKTHQIVNRVILRRRQPQISKAAYHFLNATPNPSGRKVYLVDGTSVATLPNGLLDVNRLQRCLQAFGRPETFAVVPQFRLKQRFSTNNIQLQNMQKSGRVLITPGKDLNNEVLTCNPNPIIMDIANEFNADIITNNDFRDELQLYPESSAVLKSRLIRFEWDGNGNIRFFEN